MRHTGTPAQQSTHIKKVSSTGPNTPHQAHKRLTQHTKKAPLTQHTRKHKQTPSLTPLFCCPPPTHTQHKKANSLVLVQLRQVFGHRLHHRHGCLGVSRQRCCCCRRLALGLGGRLGGSQLLSSLASLRGGAGHRVCVVVGGRTTRGNGKHRNREGRAGRRHVSKTRWQTKDGRERNVQDSN